MKKLISLLGLTFIAMSIQANDNNTYTPLEYPTLFLLQWTYNCSQQMKGNYTVRGFPQQMALQLSIEHCSCVIDEFRKDFKMSQIQTMEFSQRAAVAEIYAGNCLGVSNRM